jgi:hypothetical protein
MKLTELTTNLEQTKAHIVVLEGDKAELEQLLNHHQHQLSEARSQNKSVKDLLAISQKADAVQRLLEEQNQLVTTAQTELKKLEHSHSLETAMQESRKQREKEKQVTP